MSFTPKFAARRGQCYFSYGVSVSVTVMVFSVTVTVIVFQFLFLFQLVILHKICISA